MERGRREGGKRERKEKKKRETYQTAKGEYVTPAEVKIESDATGRHATLIATGEEVNIGSIEKMSKSKRNTVDPDDIIGEYGADVARWFMLSDSPPDRDVIWTEEGVQGSWRFVQKLWRLVREAAEIADGAGTGGGDEAAVLALRKAAHGALAKVTDEVPKLRFNRCVAHIYELSNELQASLAAARQNGGISPAYAAAVREAVEIMVILFSPMMPHLAEECWAALGTRAAWSPRRPGRRSKRRCWSRTPSRCRCRSTARSAPT